MSSVASAAVAAVVAQKSLTQWRARFYALPLPLLNPCAFSRCVSALRLAVPNVPLPQQSATSICNVMVMTSDEAVWARWKRGVWRGVGSASSVVNPMSRSATDFSSSSTTSIVAFGLLLPSYLACLHVIDRSACC
jgi:hypothetical protein